MPLGGGSGSLCVFCGGRASRLSRRSSGPYPPPPLPPQPSPRDTAAVGSRIGAAGLRAAGLGRGRGGGSGAGGCGMRRCLRHGNAAPFGWMEPGGGRAPWPRWGMGALGVPAPPCRSRWGEHPSRGAGAGLRGVSWRGWPCRRVGWGVGGSGTSRRAAGWLRRRLYRAEDLGEWGRWCGG